MSLASSALAETEAATIPARFKQVVDRHGDCLALSTDSIQWTYSELDRLSDAVAHVIAERIGDASTPVALAMDHDAPVIAAMLGVLKAGKIYLVVDTLDPPAHLRATIADAGATLLLADAVTLELAHSIAAEGVSVVELAFDLHAEVPSSSRILTGPTPDSGAWLTYTSGSTGTPKGVWQNHAGTIDHVDIFASLIEAGPGDRFTLLTSLSLMASTSATFAALLHGATLCPFRIRSEGIDQLAGWLQRQKITVYHSVPTIFRHLVRVARDDRCLESLRLLRLGGEPIRPSDVELYRKHCPEACRLMLSLSSTETGLITASLIDKHSRLPEGSIPAGLPVHGVDLQILDENGRPRSRGEVGRIAVRTAHVAQGYWQRPEATAQAFRPDERDPGIKQFITNDLGRILEDGSLQHLGRADQVVKIRGRRVDLLEVEESLLDCGLIQDAAAAADDGSYSGDSRLIGYVVLRPGVEASPEDLRRALVHLPDHLIPSHFVILDQLPQTAGGKLDRRSLPPLAKDADVAAGDGSLPRKGVETHLSSLWQQVFNRSPIGRTANFFDLGGTSIQSVQLLGLIARRMGVMLPPSALVEHSTIEALARVISDKKLQQSSDPLVLLRDASGGGRPLFLIHSGEGDLALYGQVARRLSAGPVYGFQSIGLDGERAPLRSVEAMAARYLEDVVKVDPTGPYLVGGTRMGGKVALEMARQLSLRGRRVALLVLIDFNPPRAARYYDFAVDSVRKARDWARIGGWAIIRYVRRRDKNAWLSGYRSFIMKMNCASRHDYRAKYYPGTVTLLLTSDRLTKKHEAFRQHVGDVRTIVIPGRRPNLLAPPAVDVVARELQRCLAEIESEVRGAP